MQRNRARLTGFEPGAQAFAALEKMRSANERYFPYAIDDGTTQTFYECAHGVMSSLYVPNHGMLRYLHVLDEAAKIVATHTMATHRLDDIPEINACDYLHMDVQGAEKLLQNILAVQAETNFVSLYKDQSLFSEVDICLRRHGFMLHKFNNPQSRTFKPLCLNGQILEGWSQVFWCDSVFIRDIQTWPQMTSDQLLQMAHILHEMFFSFDVVMAILVERDRLLGSRDAMVYLKMLAEYVPQLVMAPQMAVIL